MRKERCHGKRQRGSLMWPLAVVGAVELVAGGSAVRKWGGCLLYRKAKLQRGRLYTRLVLE